MKRCQHTWLTYEGNIKRTFMKLIPYKFKFTFGRCYDCDAVMFQKGILTEKEQKNVIYNHNSSILIDKEAL